MRSVSPRHRHAAPCGAVHRCILFILALTALPRIGAGAAVDRATLRSGELVVTWSAADGLGITYAGTPVFVRCTQELVVHPPDWSTAFYRSGDHSPRALLDRDADVQILHLSYPDAGLSCEQTVTVGPGQKVQVDYRYRQDQWDDARLQLGFSRPSLEFWPGCRFRALGGAGPVEGTVPVAYDPKLGAHPFVAVTELQVLSLWGSLQLKASKPLTMWDYPRRPEGFFLGYDETLPRKQDLTFSMVLEFSPPRVEAGGLVIHGMTIPAVVDDGVLNASVRVSRAAEGPGQATVSLAAKTPQGEVLRAQVRCVLGVEPTPVDLSLDVREPGPHEVEVAVVSEEERDQFRSPKRAVQVAALLTVVPGRIPYTNEAAAALIVLPAAGLRGKRLAVTIACAGVELAAERPVICGVRNTLTVPLAQLPEGRSTLLCTLLADGKELAVARTELLRVPPKQGAVKIDGVSRGLLVDDLPLLPFGFYCVFPVGSLPEDEATQGFTHIAPYQSRAEGHTAETLAQIRAYLDRCAALGLKVHYDIRQLAQAPASEEKWARLKAEVDAFRDHPALLCWYLCDEPAGQRIEPSVLEQAYRFVKELDPYHPITIVFCVPNRAEEYLNAMDIMMADPYPIPSRPVTLVSEWTEQLRQVTRDRMPLWIVPQAFGGGEWWQREPSFREERVMTYLALIHGATGIQYFIRRAPIGNPISPSLWSECRRLSLEAAELTPWLLSTEVKPRVASDSGAVHVAAWRHRGDILILAANTENRPKPLRLKLTDLAYTGQARVLFESRAVPLDGGALAEPIDAFGTRAYLVPVEPVAAETIPVAPENLTTNASFEEQANVGTPDACYVSVGADRGASLFVDARVARHGRHSLRLTTPVEGQGLTVRPFPVRLQQAQTYRLSIWAKATAPGLRFELGIGGLDVAPQSFELSTEWQEYALTGKALEALSRAGIHFRLVSSGTAWLDLLQLVPVDAQ